MASPLLETKLHVPRRRRGLVARPRLNERLRRAAESTLTLVSAPAGFGKTTLLAEWLAAAPADAAVDVRSRVHWTSTANGGDGAVRELIELILRAQGRWAMVVDAYLAEGQRA